MSGLAQANALHIPFADGVFQMVCTSPPYWGLRDYGTGAWVDGDSACDHKAPPTGGPNPVRYTPGGSDMFRTANDKSYRDACGKCGAVRVDSQLGLEPVPDCQGWATGQPCGECYICHMVQVYREVRRVLRDDGVCFVNLGDSYASSVNGTSAAQTKANGNDDRTFRDKPFSTVGHGLKPKDMCGIPWRVALALQADGWWLRSDIIWSKSNPMPESVTDRPTKSHEYVFLLAKSARYFWDAEAVKEPTIWANDPRAGNGRHTYDGKRDGTDGQGQEAFVSIDPSGRNLRTVWSIPTQPYSGAHYATFPEALVERCVLAGSKPGSRVFDPFCGSGTTIQVARRLGRQGYGLDLSRVYLEENALPRALGKNTAAALATLPLFGGTEQADEPPKQDQLGKRTYTGFNARWKEQESRP